MSKKLVLLFCPPCTGKTVHCLAKFSSYKRVCLVKVFEENPDLNLRQVLNKYIITYLKEGKNVVVDDCNEKSSKRMSYVNLVLKKLSDVRIECLTLRPLCGIEQSLWSREMIIAESSFLKEEGVRDWGKIDTVIRSWQHYAERPTEEDDLSLIEGTTELVVQTSYKFEVPALFIQWEALYRESKEGSLELVRGVTEAIHKWYTCNQCGRVIIVHEGANTPGVTSAEKESQIRYILKELKSKIKECPVYLIYLHQTSSAGNYCIPPLPGILAFLFRLHHISLHGKHCIQQSTMYLYHSTTHMKMAEKAGVKHIKASRMFSHPNSAASSQATIRPAIPDMLDNCQIIAPLQGWTDLYNTESSLPLYDLSHSAKSGIVCKKMKECGRTLYMAYKDQDMLDMYQQMYTDNATPIDSVEESKIEQFCIQATPSQSFVSPRGASNVTVSLEKDRGLPSWMMPANKKKGSQSVKNEESVLEDEPAKKKSKKASLKSVGSSTVYIQSDEELVESLKLALEQAGEKVPTPDEVEEFLSQHGSLLSKSQTGSTAVTLSSSKSRVEEESSDDIQEKPKKTRTSQRKQAVKKRVKETQAEKPDSPVKKSRLNEEYSEQTLNDLDELFSEGDEPRRRAPPPRRKRVPVADIDIDEVIHRPTTPPDQRKTKASVASPQKAKSSGISQTTESQDVSRPSPVFHGNIADANEAQFDMFLNSLIGGSDDENGDDQHKFTVPSSKKSDLNDTVLLDGSLFGKSSADKKSAGGNSKDSATTIPSSLVRDSSTESRQSSKTRSSKESIATVPDSLVKDSSSLSTKGSKSPRSSVTLPESLVKDSSSFTSKDSKSPRANITLPESLVRDSSSFSSKNSKSPKANFTLPDSLVKDSSSFSAKDSKSPGSSITLPDSLVKDSSSFSAKDSKSPGSSITLPNSLVKDSSSFSSKGSKSLASEVVSNSLVSNSTNNTSSASKSSQSSKPSVTIPDSYVKNTSSSSSAKSSHKSSSSVSDLITTIPDSSSLNSAGSSESKKEAQNAKILSARDPFLDDFI